MVTTATPGDAAKGVGTSLRLRAPLGTYQNRFRDKQGSVRSGSSLSLRDVITWLGAGPIGRAGVKSTVEVLNGMFDFTNPAPIPLFVLSKFERTSDEIRFRTNPRVD